LGRPGKRLVSFCDGEGVERNTRLNVTKKQKPAELPAGSSSVSQ
jgi:hypothetical protein